MLKKIFTFALSFVLFLIAREVSWPNTWEKGAEEQWFQLSRIIFKKIILEMC